MKTNTWIRDFEAQAETRGFQGRASQRQIEFASKLARFEGLTYIDEAWALFEFARTLAPEKKEFCAVEIGSWKGRSTIAIGFGLKERGGGTVYAIDPHEDGDTYEAFLNNVAIAGVGEFVRPLRMASDKAYANLKGQLIDLLFVDGSHEYLDVANDIRVYTALLAEGAAVGFNDPSHPGVRRALSETVLRSQSPFREAQLIDNTLFFSYRPKARWTRSDAQALFMLRRVLALRFIALRCRPLLPTRAVVAGHRFGRWLVDRIGRKGKRSA